VPNRKSQARGKRSRFGDRLGILSVGAIGLLVLGLGGGAVYDQVRMEMVRPQTIQNWPRAKAVLQQRLRQGEPLEFGAVWATHSRMYCGLVNGRHSFSGLAGMTPFVVEGDKATFALDQTALAFAPYWRDCMTDKWITVLDGSMEAGGCATKLGQSKCVTVVGG
jgi:hypothetical protein